MKAFVDAYGTCVCENVAYEFTNTSTWSLFEDSSWNKHEIVYPEVTCDSTCCLLSKQILPVRFPQMRGAGNQTYLERRVLSYMSMQDYSNNIENKLN